MQTGDLPSCLKKEKPGNFLFKKNQQPYGSSLKCHLERYCFYILALHLGLTICAAPKSSRFTLEFAQKSHFDVLLLLGGCDLKHGALLQVLLIIRQSNAGKWNILLCKVSASLLQGLVDSSRTGNRKDSQDQTAAKAQQFMQSCTKQTVSQTLRNNVNTCSPKDCFSVA